MGTNIFTESCKTFIVKNFGIVLDEKIIPVESIGIITYIGNGKVKMSFCISTWRSVNAEEAQEIIDWQREQIEEDICFLQGYLYPEKLKEEL